MKNEKSLLKILIENDQLFSHEFNGHQKLHVIVNKAIESLKITSDGRELKREDGTPLTDLTKTIEEINLRNGEVLRYFKKADKPNRDKGFA
jgi:hypothetical protein